MKKIYALLLAVLISGGLSAQMLPEGQMVKAADCELPTLTPSANKVNVVDTLEDYLFRASGAVLFSSIDGGYVTGTGYFDNSGVLIPITDGTGMHYDGVANARVIEVLTWFGDVQVTGTADAIYGRVYSVQADTTPNQLLGEGQVTSNDLVGSSNFVYSAIPITNGTGDTQGQPFLLAVEYPGIDDTLGIVTSNPDSADGQGEQRLRQLASSSFGGAWVSIEALWGSFNCDAVIVPVIDDAPAALDQAPSAQGVTLLGNYPNPASVQSTIRYSLDKPQEVSVKVFDLTARTILETGMEYQNAGEHEVTVDVSNLASGSYYYTIETANTKLTSKIVVSK